MKTTTSPGPRSTVLLEVEVPSDRLQRSIDESLRRLGRRTRVAGFRPGKAPRPMLERALGVRRDVPDGPNPILDEAKDELFHETMAEFLRESELDPLAIPEPEWTRFEEGSGAAYRVTFPVRPEVKLGDYQDYPFGVEIETIDDAKIDRVVEQLREQHSSLVAVEDRPIREGDWAVIGFQGTRDGLPFEGGSAERLPLVVGRDRMIPGFEANLVGMAVGEEKDFELTFPDDYREAELAGQTVQFHVLVREVREQLLPDVDDDFAQGVGPYAGLAAMRADIATRLEASARDRARHEFSDRIIEYAVGNATVEIPEVMVDQEVEVMHDELRLRLAEQGIGYEEYLRVTGKDDAALHAEYREPAERRVKTLLVLSAIADAEGVETDDAEIEAEIERARHRYEENPKLVAYFESPRGRAYLRTTMRRTAVVERLVDRWLAAHPDIGPIPHLEDAEAPGVDVAGVARAAEAAEEEA